MKGSIKVRIQPKRLASGRCQVKFRAQIGEGRRCYGYMLADADAALKDVMQQLESQLNGLRDRDQFYHAHLYQLGRPKEISEMQFWVYEY